MREKNRWTIQRNLSSNKKDGQILIAAGCLTQRDRELVVKEVPKLDGILSTRRWMDILEVLAKIQAASRPRQTPIYHLPETATIGMDEKGVIRAAAQGSSAYLKIADGCRRPCAFCAIPLIKGTAVSRPMKRYFLKLWYFGKMGSRKSI